MDLATLGGILAGIGLVVASISLEPTPAIFIDFSSLMLVLGGTIAAIMVCFTFGEVRQAVWAAFKIFSLRAPNTDEVVAVMVKIAEISRSEGIAALDKIQTDNHILRKVTHLIANNVDSRLIKNTVGIEIRSMHKRHKIAISVFARLGSIAPIMGIIGTLAGLIQMLTNLSDLSTVGPAMAISVLATFYGAILSNILFLPLADKLRARSMQAELNLHVIFEGAKCILENNNPRFVYERLSSFLPPKHRDAGQDIDSD